MKSPLLDACPRDCPGRKPGCKADCASWKKARAEFDALKAETRRKRELENALDGIQIRSVRSAKARRHRKR